MDVDSETAGRLLDVSASYFRRCALSLGFRPATRRTGGGRKNVWGVRHLVAIALVPELETRGVPTDSAVRVAHRIGVGFASDEAAEAAITNGRAWALVVARVAAPELVSLEDVAAAEKELMPALARIGATVQKVPILLLWEQLCAAARSAISEQDAAKAIK